MSMSVASSPDVAPLTVSGTASPQTPAVPTAARLFFKNARREIGSPILRLLYGIFFEDGPSSNLQPAQEERLERLDKQAASPESPLKLLALTSLLQFFWSHFGQTTGSRSPLNVNCSKMCLQSSHWYS
jgi:hypothetical protein